MCINCGSYFKDYNHSEDLSEYLSDDLNNSVIGTYQNLADYLRTGYCEDQGSISRKFNLSDSGLNPKDSTITYNVTGNDFDLNGILREMIKLVK